MFIFNLFQCFSSINSNLENMYGFSNLYAWLNAKTFLMFFLWFVYHSTVGRLLELCHSCVWTRVTTETIPSRRAWFFQTVSRLFDSLKLANIWSLLRWLVSLRLFLRADTFRFKARQKIAFTFTGLAIVSDTFFHICIVYLRVRRWVGPKMAHLYYS